MDTTTLLIDGDIILYKVSWACQSEVDYGDLITYTTSTQELYDTFDADINNLLKASGCDNYVIAISSSNNFRKKLFKEYKANRKGTRKPLGYKKLQQYCLDTHPCIPVMDGLEADDILGMMMTRPDHIRVTSMTASIDKDMLTIPGRHYNIDKGTIEDVDLRLADHNFYTQVLVGDTCDNYKGCPSIGPAKAQKLLQGCESHEDYWWAITDAFKKAGLNEADALIQARMARILRAEDYNFIKEEVKLWLPKRSTIV